MLSVIGWAAKQPMRRYGVYRERDGDSAGPAAPDRARASWRLSDRLGLGLAWLLGLLFCAIAAAIVIYFLVEGIRYLRRACWSPTRRPAQRGPDRRVPRPTARDADHRDMAMAIAVPVGVGDRGLAQRVWTPDGARTRGGIGCRDARRRAVGRARAVRDRSCSRLPALGFLSQTTNGVVLGQSFFAAAAMLSLVGLPLVVANARGTPGDPGPRARGVLRGRQDQVRHDPAGPAAGGPAVDVTGTMLGLGRVIGDTAIILVLLGNADLPCRGLPLLCTCAGTGTR